MEFSVKRDVFLGGVQRTLGIVDRRTSMPVLNNVLIRAESERIRIVATDREIGLIAAYEAQVVKDGEITLPARKLYEMLREIQGEEVHFKKEESNWVAINCGKVNFRVPGIPAEERDQIFEQYRQSKKNKPLRGSKGTGLGLTFCKLAVEAHGGRIWVDNAKTLSGACFNISLPIAT